jgi:NTE family protein
MGPQVIPIPAQQPLGLGKDRAIAFGGGGEWFVCWTLAYCATAQSLGTDLSTADVTVGTSAGSIVGSYLTAHQVTSAYQQFEQLSANPAALEKMIVTNTGEPSQRRAAEVLRDAQSSHVESVQRIGRAAMAARNVPAADYAASLTTLLGCPDWPSPAHHVTAIDCYSAERVIVSHESGIPIAWACAASSSLPGVNGPVWLGDHYCMDGGVSASSTHSDLLAGAKRVIIFSMMSHAPKSGSFGFSMRINPNEIHDEVDYLESAGSEVMLICADPAEGIDFMDPGQLKNALELGAARATSDIAALAAFWTDSEPTRD